jgi:membrane protein
MKWINKEKIKNNKLVKVATTKKFSILSGKTISEVLSFMFKSFTDGNITTRAAAIAYNLFLSIFPGIIFLFTLIPYLPIPDLENQVMSLLREFMPDYSYKTFETLIMDIISKQRGDLLSFSALSTLYFATNGISSFISAFQNSISFQKSENWVKKRINSFIIAAIVTLLLALSTILMLFTNIAVNLLVEYGLLTDKIIVYLILTAKWIIVFLMFYFTLDFLYYYGVPKKERRWKFFSLGTVFSTVMTMLVSWGFSYYVNNFGHYNKFYGSLGAIIVLLLWLYFISLTILIGFEMNRSIDV